LKRSLEYAEEKGFDVVVATDPDTDRCGIAVKDDSGKWQVLTANDLWALLVWLRIKMMKELSEEGRLSSEYEALLKRGYLIVTWVSSDLIEKVGRAFGLHIRRPAVGFSKIAEVALDEIIMPEFTANHSLDFVTFREKYKQNLSRLRETIKLPPLREVLDEISSLGRGLLLGGFEESNGVSLGGHILEKDGLLAAVVMLEVFEYAKTKGASPWHSLVNLWKEFGYFATANIPLTLKGSTAKADRDKVMAKADEYYRRLKEGQEIEIGGKVVTEAHRGEDLAGFNEKGYKFIFADGTWLIIRPSGTEPKIRFYGQSNVDQREFEGRSDEDFLPIKRLEDRKLDRFVRKAIKQIESEAKEEPIRARKKESPILTPVLVFDIDGTLAPRKEPLGEKVVTIMKKLMDMGMPVVIATGNPLNQELRARLKGIWGYKNFGLSVNVSTQVFHFEERVLRENLDYRQGLREEDKPRLKKIITDFINNLKQGVYDKELTESGKVTTEELSLLKTILAENELKIEDRVTRLAFRYEDFKRKMDEATSMRIRIEMSGILRKILLAEDIKGYDTNIEGKTTIAIGPVGVGKRDVLTYVFENFGVVPQQVCYFGDEFDLKGNDFPVTSIADLNIFSAGTKQGLPPNVLYIGEGPQATLSALMKMSAYIRGRKVKGLPRQKSTEGLVEYLRNKAKQTKQKSSSPLGSSEERVESRESENGDVSIYFDYRENPSATRRKRQKPQRQPVRKLQRREKPAKPVRTPQPKPQPKEPVPAGTNIPNPHWNRTSINEGGHFKVKVEGSYITIEALQGIIGVGLITPRSAFPILNPVVSSLLDFTREPPTPKSSSPIKKALRSQEDVLMYPKPRDPNLKLDKYDREHYRWDPNIGYWYRQIVKGGCLVLGTWEDVKQSTKQGLAPTYMENHIAIRISSGYTIYLFDAHTHSKDYLDEPYERGEIDRHNNNQIWVDDHVDTFEYCGPDARIALDIAEAGWVSNHIWVYFEASCGREKEIRGPIFALKLLGQGLSPDPSWVAYSAQQLEARKMKDKILREYRPVESNSCHYSRYFEIPNRPRNTQAIFNLESDATSASWILSFLRDVAQKDNVEPSTVHICTSPPNCTQEEADNPAGYGHSLDDVEYHPQGFDTVEDCRILARDLPQTFLVRPADFAPDFAFSPAKDSKINTVTLRDLEKERVDQSSLKNWRDLFVYATTMVMGCSFEREVGGKLFLDRVEALMRSLDNVLGDFVSTYSRKHIHATVKAITGSNYKAPNQPAISLAPANIDAMLQILSEAKPFRIKLDDIRIVRQGEVLLRGSAFGEKSEEILRRLRRRLEDEALFGVQSDIGHNVHVCLGYLKEIPSEKDLNELKETWEKLIAGYPGEYYLPPVTVSKLTLAHYSHRSLATVAAQIELPLGLKIEEYPSSDAISRILIDEAQLHRSDLSQTLNAWMKDKISLWKKLNSKGDIKERKEQLAAVVQKQLGAIRPVASVAKFPQEMGLFAVKKRGKKIRVYFPADEREDSSNNFEIGIPDKVTFQDKEKIADYIIARILNAITNNAGPKAQIVVPRGWKSAIERSKNKNSFYRRTKRSIEGYYGRGSFKVSLHYRKPRSKGVASAPSVGYENRRGTYLAIDFGGTSIKLAALVRGKEVMLGQIKISIYSAHTIQEYRDLVEDVLLIGRKRLYKKVGRRKINGIGISWNSPIKKNKIILHKFVADELGPKGAEELTHLVENIRPWVENEFGRGVNIEIVNDGSAGAFQAVSALQLTNVAFIGLGTSTAFGFINQNGELAPGFCEIHHNRMDLSDIVGGFSFDSDRNIPGTIEFYLGQRGLFRAAYKIGYIDNPANIGFKNWGRQAHKLIAAANKGDKEAIKVGEIMGINLAEAIAVLRNHWLIKNVVIGGGTTTGRFGNTIRNFAQETLDKQFPDLKIKLYKYEGDSSHTSSLGAAHYVSAVDYQQLQRARLEKALAHDYKVFIFDVDGTLMVGSGDIASDIIKRIVGLLKLGKKVMFCSGRPFKKKMGKDLKSIYDQIVAELKRRRLSLDILKEVYFAPSNASYIINGGRLNQREYKIGKPIFTLKLQRHILQQSRKGKYGYLIHSIEERPDRYSFYLRMVAGVSNTDKRMIGKLVFLIITG